MNAATEIKLVDTLASASIVTFQVQTEGGVHFSEYHADEFSENFSNGDTDVTRESLAALIGICVIAKTLKSLSIW